MTSTTLDLITITEHAQRLAAALGTGWTIREHNAQAEDRTAVLVGPVGEVLHLTRFVVADANPAARNKIRISGAAPVDLPGRDDLFSACKVDVRADTTTPRVASFVKRHVLPSYTSWMVTQRAKLIEKLKAEARPQDPAPVAVEITRESIPTRVQKWADAAGVSYAPGYADGVLVLVVDGETLTPGAAVKRILEPAENPDAYDVFEVLAGSVGLDQARADVKVLGVFPAVITQWVARWTADNPTSDTVEPVEAEKPSDAPAPAPKCDTPAVSIPELADQYGPRCGYRDWTVSHGLPWSRFDADPIEGALRTRTLDGWALAVPAHGDGEVIVRLVKTGEPVHPLHGTTYDTPNAAYEALFNAGAVAVRVYEDQAWTVQVWRRVGRGLSLNDRVLMADYAVPPATNKRIAATEAYAATQPGATGVYAERHQQRDYPPVVDGDLVDVSGTLFERSSAHSDGWAYVPSTRVFGEKAPAVMSVIERVSVDGHAVSDGHRIDLTAQVPITWGLYGWESELSAVDGQALDVAEALDDRPDNTACVEALDEIGQECEHTDHWDAWDAVNGEHRPTGAELISLLGNAVMRNHYAPMDKANADVKRLHDLATHTADHELGAQVLRVLFGLELMHPATTTSTPTPDGGYVVRVDAEEHALISGLIIPGGVNHLGIYSEAFKTLPDRFPPDAFEVWTANNPDGYDADDVNTDMEG